MCEDGRYHPDQVAAYGLADDRYFTPERLAMRMGLPPLMQDLAIWARESLEILHLG